MANYSTPRKNSDGGIIFGFIILGLGLLLLLKKLGVFYPAWMLTWPMILIVIGVFTLIKHQFKSLFGGLTLFAGVYFLLEREFDFDFGLHNYILPIGLIILGLYLISQKQKEKQVIESIREQMQSRKSSSSTEEGSTGTEPLGTASAGSGFTFSDRLNIDAIFSGVNKRVLSKNFQGGKLTAAFGGVDLDLTQADFKGLVTLQVDVIFGGMKIIVPPHWDVRTEVSNIAAGVEDKRIYRQSEVDPDKVLVLRGTVLFGGLEIKSF
ncbi:DUF5668 domain-containing protein [Algoriphagus sp. CAU 1675]|uniref:LiaF transmembrane domain-containing protein n=1 Tax=Algoriphagus sp. CAU 1675 TaxID=3032597 RepID=UPI0023DC3A76|nr:DUF5668 domain-containing protein [Algoriphagus sp. CAU 1675]MDF2159058.1 DUF5668 domain-containing protein [Algoriphagus sp. CAU 1675]